MAIPTLNPLSNQTTGDASVITDAFLDDVEDNGSGIINAGRYNVENLRPRNFTNQISITINGPAELNGLNNTPRTFWSVEAPQKWIGQLTFKDFSNASIFNAAPGSGNDGAVSYNWYDAVTPAWQTDMSHFILDGLTFDNVRIASHFSTGGTVQSNFAKNTPEAFIAENPHLQKLQIRNCTVRNSGGGFSFQVVRLGETKTIAEIEALVAAEDWDNIPILIVNNLIEDINSNRDGTTTSNKYLNVAGNGFRIGPNRRMYQDINGGMYFANNVMRRIFDSRTQGAVPGRNRDNSQDEGPELQGIRTTGIRGVVAENNYFRSIRNIRPSEYDFTKNNEAWYSKVEDLAFRDNIIINCGRGEGTITFKSGGDPTGRPDNGTFDPDVPTVAQQEYGSGSPSGRRNNIDDNIIIYAANSFMSNDTRAIRSPSHLNSDSSTVKRNLVYGWVNWINSNTNVNNSASPGGSSIFGNSGAGGDEISDNEWFENAPSPLPATPTPLDLGGPVPPDTPPEDPPPEPDPEPEPPTPDPEPEPGEEPTPPTPPPPPPPLPAPTSQFTVDFRSGEAPLDVQFTDLSADDPTNWDWDFGDGTTSTLQSPSHTYSDVGFFTVTLTVANPQGQDTETKIAYIEATEPPPPAPEPPPPPPTPPSEGQVRRAKVVRTTTVPVLLELQQDGHLLLQQVGGPDPETIDGPDLYLILQQGVNPEIIEDPGIIVGF